MSLEELLARWGDKQAWIYVHRYHAFKPIPDKTVSQYLATFEGDERVTITAGCDSLVTFGPPWVLNIEFEMFEVGTIHLQIKGM